MAETTLETTQQNNNAVATNGREMTMEPERYVAPAVDIYEMDNGLTVTADMPGLDRESISISAEKDILTIRGTAKAQENERNYIYREFEPTNYFRQFTLGNKIDQGGIHAEYKHGVLRLRLPFAEEVKPRQIEVKVD